MPILDPSAFEFFSRSAEQTRRLGVRLGMLLQPGSLICLSGDLGTGKTTFVQGLAQGWGSLDQASSPTFVLVNAYRRPAGETLHHLDAYRLEGLQEAIDLDLDWMLETGALVIEWAERIQSALPEEFLWINMRWLTDEQRGMIFVPHGEYYHTLLDSFRHQVTGGAA